MILFKVFDANQGLLSIRVIMHIIITSLYRTLFAYTAKLIVKNVSHPQQVSSFVPAVFGTGLLSKPQKRTVNVWNLQNIKIR